MIKKIISVILAVCFASSMVLATAASSNIPYNTNSSDTIVKEFVIGMYSSDYKNYRVLDQEGREITKQFLSEIDSFVKNDDWEKINEYCTENSLLLVQKIYSYVQKGKALEQRKTEVERCVGTVKSINAPDGKIYEKKVIYDLWGTITYNPNTGAISDADVDMRNIILESGCSHYDSYADAIIRANKYSAQIIGELTISWNTMIFDGYPIGDEVIFKPLKHSFIINSDPS